MKLEVSNGEIADKLTIIEIKLVHPGDGRAVAREEGLELN